MRIVFFKILTSYHKYLLFQFLSIGISVHIPIQTGVQTGRSLAQKNGHILLKNVHFED